MSVVPILKASTSVVAADTGTIKGCGGLDKLKMALKLMLMPPP